MQACVFYKRLCTSNGVVTTIDAACCDSLVSELRTEYQRLLGKSKLEKHLRDASPDGARSRVSRIAPAGGVGYVARMFGLSAGSKVASLFSTMDTDGDGYVSFREFVASVRKSSTADVDEAKVQSHLNLGQECS